MSYIVSNTLLCIDISSWIHHLSLTCKRMFIVFLKLSYFEVSFSYFVTYNFYFQILTFHQLFKYFTPLVSSELISPWFIPCSTFFWKYTRSSELGHKVMAQSWCLLQIPHRPATSPVPDLLWSYQSHEAGFQFEAKAPNLLDNQIQEKKQK